MHFAPYSAGGSKASAKRLDSFDCFLYKTAELRCKRDRIAAVRCDVVDGALRDLCLEHFFQTHGLRAQLNLIFLFCAEFSVLVLNRIQPDREIQRRDHAALGGCFRFYAVAFPGNSHSFGEYRELIQLC